jgi:hypothetical protein
MVKDLTCDHDMQVLSDDGVESSFSSKCMISSNSMHRYIAEQPIPYGFERAFLGNEWN